MNRKIAYLAGTFPSRSETFVYREVRELRQRGWTVQAATLNPPTISKEDSFDDLSRDLIVVYDRSMLWRATVELAAHPVRAISTLVKAIGDAIVPGERLSPAGRGKLIGQALAGLKLAGAMRARGTAHVHCHFAHAPTSVGMYAAMQLGVPLSFTGHANDLFQRRALLKRKLQRAKFVACISQWHRELYESIWPDGRAKYQIIRCGVDVNQWSSTNASNPTGPLRVLSVCRLVEKKGVDTLIRAIARVPESRLTVAGDGPQRDNLTSLSRELKCENRICFLGAVDNETVRRLMCDETDVLALACRTDRNGDRDGVPVVLMEAMACGLCVISGDLPAIRELIQHDVNGLLVAENDDEAMSELLRTSSLQVRQRLGRTARQSVKNEFSLELNVNRLEQAINAR